MPQIWVSYEELGAHLKCSAEAARDKVGRSGWSRRRCSDGLTRVKLPPAIMTDYLRDSWNQPAGVDLGQSQEILQEFQKLAHLLAKTNAVALHN